VGRLREGKGAQAFFREFSLIDHRESQRYNTTRVGARWADALARAGLPP
jgi:hypothetical protein